MNTQYTLKAMNVNGKSPLATEIPLWAGVSNVPDNVNGRYLTMSVTKDRDWLWVRFSDKPSEKARKELESCGFSFSVKRMAWHAMASELTCNKLQKWGAIGVSFARVASAMPPRPVENLTKHIDLDAEPAKQAKLPKQAKQPKAKPVEVDTTTLAMLNALTALTNTVAQLQSKLDAMNFQAQQAQPKQPQPIHYSNGYHVGGLELGK